MPLRILEVGAFPFPAPLGSQTYALGCATALAARGHEVTVACLSGSAGPVPPAIRVMRAPRVPGGAFVGSGPHWSRVPGSALLVRTLMRALNRPWDVIAAHNVDAPLLAWLAERLRGRRVRLVRHVHAKMEDELGDWFPNAGPLTRRLGRAADRMSAAVADRSIAISAGVHAELLAAGLDAALVPPGVHLADLAGADAGRARARWDLGDRPWVVYAGNADRYQELPALIAAVGRLPDAGLLLVVSNGDLTPLRAAIRAANLPDARVRLIESASFADHKDALAAGTVGGLPRTRCAGFPVKLLNQLGIGLPTVCAAGSSQPIPGVLTVPDGDVPALADALQGLVADPARRRELADGAREAIRARWTWDVRGAELESAYVG